MKRFLFLILILFILNEFVSSSVTSLGTNSVILPLVGKRVKQDEKPNKNVIYNQKEKSYSIKMRGDIVQILTSINVGGVSQEVIVDTGSVLLVVPSTLCNSCQQPLPHYHPSSKIEYMDCEASECKEMGNACIEFKSNNMKVCGNQVRYLQNTEIITILVQDTFSFTNDTDEVLATFGSIVSNRGRSLEHGIIGLGKTCYGCRKSPIELIFEKTNILRTFSMWLDSNYQGTLLLGDVDPQFENSITYTPMITIEESHYGVFLKSARLYDKISKSSIVITSKDFGEVIIDSGTSEALIDIRAFTKIKNFLQQDCKPGLCGSNSLLEGYCYNYPESYFNLFPTIHVEMLGGATLEVSPKSYITSSYVNGIKYRCFAIKPSPLRSKSIIGLSWLRNNYIVFDTEHNRMGFAKGESQFNGTDSESSFDFSEFAREQQNNEDSENDDGDDDDIEFSSSYQDSDSNELKPRLNDDKKKKKYVVKISDEDLVLEDLEIQLEEFNSILINGDLTNKEAKQILNSRKLLIEQINQLKLKQKQKNEQLQQDLLIKQEKEKIEEEKEELVIQKEELKNEHALNNQYYNSKLKKNHHNKQQQDPKNHHNNQQHHHNQFEFNEPKQRKLRESANKKEGTSYSTIHRIIFNDLLNNYNNTSNNINSSNNLEQCNKTDNEQIFNSIKSNNNNNNNNDNNNNNNNNSINIDLLSKNNKEYNMDNREQHPIVLKYDPDTKRKNNLPLTSNVNNSNKNKLPNNITPYYKNSKSLINSNNKLSKKSNNNNNIDNNCSFDFTQKKEFEWIDNNGRSFTFWESTIVNLSPVNSINKFILSTMDNVQYTIGMIRNTTTIDQRTTTIISLPINQTISANSSYRFIYISNSKDALSFSVGECNLQI